MLMSLMLTHLNHSISNSHAVHGSSEENADLPSTFMRMFVDKLTEQTEQRRGHIKALLGKQSDGELSEEQWEAVIAEFLQLLSNQAMKQEIPETDQLIERITRLIEQYNASHALANDMTTRESVIGERQRIFSDFASWLQQLPALNQQHVIEQLMIPLLAGMNVDNKGDMSIFAIDAGANTANRKSDLEANWQGKIAVDLTVPKGNTKTNAPQPTQSAANAPPLNGSQPNVVAVVKNGEVNFPQNPKLSVAVEAVTSNGELVEMPVQHKEGVLNTHTLASSSAPDASAPKAATRPVMWLSHDFAETLQQHVVRHLKINPGGVSQARISLYPENLGQVDVRISSHNGVLTAHLVADTWIAKELLDGQLDHLRQALQNQGLQVNKLEVSIGQQGLPSRHFHHPYYSHERGESSSLKQEQPDAFVNVANSYTDSETSRVESWRNPHSSVNYTV